MGQGSAARRRIATSAVVALALGLGTLGASSPRTESAGAAGVITVPAQQPTIQAAIDAASDGDTVVVSAGTYHGGIDFHGKDITVQGLGQSSTIIDADQGTGVDIGPGGELTGFTITNGSASFGAGLVVHGTGSVIFENIFDGNAQSAGGGGAAIRGNVSSPTIESNVFRNNTCDDQFVSGVISFANDSSPVIRNNVFLNNDCRAINLVLPDGNQPVVANNTIVGNRAGIQIGGPLDPEGTRYRNNMIVGNGAGLTVIDSVAPQGPIWDHNLVFGNSANYVGVADLTGSDGNLSADPRFVSVPFDLHLSPDSPAVDQGTAADAPLTDFDRTPRPQDGNGDGLEAVDIGAFEVWEGLYPVIRTDPVRITEGDGGLMVASVPVHVSANFSEQDATVQWSTVAATASSATDFVPAQGSLVLAPGELTKTISVAVTGDRLDESNESFLVRLSEPTMATIGGAGESRVTIVDDDEPPMLSPSGASVREGNQAVHALVFPVKLSAPSGKAISVRYRTVGGTATPGSDYTSKQGVLRFSPGETATTVTVWAKGDRRVERAETLTLAFFSVDNARINPAHLHVTGRILNDD